MLNLMSSYLACIVCGVIMTIPEGVTVNELEAAHREVTGHERWTGRGYVPGPLEERNSLVSRFGPQLVAMRVLRGCEGLVGA